MPPAVRMYRSGGPALVYCSLTPALRSSHTPRVADFEAPEQSMTVQPAESSAPSDRAVVARTFRRYEQEVAEAVTDTFLARHLDWVARYGERARQAGIEDARFHVQFLGAAIESDSRPAFRDYVRWTTGYSRLEALSPCSCGRT